MRQHRWMEYLEDYDFTLHYTILVRQMWWLMHSAGRDLREEILKEFHCSRFTVHLGGTKMYRDLRRQYYWSGMKKHVGDFVHRCLTCQQVKAEHQRPTGLLQPFEVAE